MVNPYLRFKIKRFIRHSKSTPANIVNFFNTQVFASGKRYAAIRRFTWGWITLILLLFGTTAVQAILERKTILASVPKAGGTHREAVVGELDNFNPLFAIDGANADVARLVFAGLVEHSPEGELVGELAESWDSNKNADEFVVTLKPGLTWHDGEELTAEDITFTIDLIQNPDTRSPRKDTWRGIITEAVDERTVKFSLPNSFAPFPQLLTVGILPEHILHSVEPKDLRVSGFATSPTGAGAFKLDEFDANQNRVVLSKFTDYAQGTPQLNRLIVRGYSSFEDAKEALKQKLVDSLGSVDEFRDYGEQESYHEERLRLAIGNYLFMNISKPTFAEAGVRQAIVYGINLDDVRRAIDFKKPPITSAFLPIQLELGEDQAQLTYNQDKAVEKLEELGWEQGADGVRAKEGKKLTFTLAVPDRPAQVVVAQSITNQLQKIGVDVNVDVSPSESFQSDIALNHAYDAALISISNGIDPDLFVFWHSSQASEGGLNFSEIKDTRLDESLEAGRTRAQRSLRVAKYETFAERWRELAPAVALNQELYHYVRRDRAIGPLAETLLQPSDRFNTVENWTVLFESIEQKDLQRRE